jgi:Lon protease-like protein
MTDLELAAGAARLRVFPLPGTVLLPEVDLPLQVFEPRYRALVADAVAGDRLLAVPQILEGAEGEHLGAPAVYPLCTAGVISAHRLLPDGRSILVVTPVARVRLEEELAGPGPWRSFRARVLAEQPARTESLSAAGQRLLALLGPTLSERKDSGAAGAWRTLNAMPLERVPASVAAMVLRSGLDRQAYLGDDSSLGRARIVEDCLVSALAEARATIVAEA